MEEKSFEICFYTENHVGVLSTITNMFTRRRINIESLHTYLTEIPGIHQIKIATCNNEEDTARIVRQIEKKVDVIKAFYHEGPSDYRNEIHAVRQFIKERLAYHESMHGEQHQAEQQ